jgi:hypothetical protein
MLILLLITINEIYLQSHAPLKVTVFCNRTLAAIHVSRSDHVFIRKVVNSLFRNPFFLIDINHANRLIKIIIIILRL